ncbi:unnamed protein product [Ambrosiozyma monospora]|uniref:Unnamed protein product n=1 Tax=Ambrosiozyma monospora TaxID=43982 RepID=A0A9W6YRG7_AMBMO|nr:unnamed protein product [Ambrosiozyma monospora]
MSTPTFKHNIRGSLHFKTTDKSTNTASISQVLHTTVSDSENSTPISSSPQNSTQVVYNSTALVYDSNNDSVNTLTSATFINTPTTTTNSGIMMATSSTPGSTSVPKHIMIPNNDELSNLAAVQESPKLLATSVTSTTEMDIGGRLVPSSSTISLLSLNAQASTSTSTTYNEPMSPLISSQQSPNILSAALPPLSNSSSSSSSAWPHKTKITQQRLPTSTTQLSYLSSVIPATVSVPSTGAAHRRVSFTSPNMVSSSNPNSCSRPLTISRNGSFSTNVGNPLHINRPLYQQQQQQQQLHQHQRTLSTTSNTSSVLIEEPDSPVLDPTSLSNSPSNFYLSHSSPPGSLSSRHNSFVQIPRLSNQNTPNLAPTTIAKTTANATASTSTLPGVGNTNSNNSSSNNNAIYNYNFTPNYNYNYNYNYKPTTTSIPQLNIQTTTPTSSAHQCQYHSHHNPTTTTTSNSSNTNTNTTSNHNTPLNHNNSSTHHPHYRTSAACILSQDNRAYRTPSIQ